MNYEGTGAADYLPDKLNQDRQPWPNAALHRQVVNAALSGAKAMASHQDGLLSAVGFHDSLLNDLVQVTARTGRKTCLMPCGIPAAILHELCELSYS